MEKEKRARLEAKGWEVGSTEDLLGLTSEETAYVDLRIKLSRLDVRDLRGTGGIWPDYDYKRLRNEEG